MNFPLAPALIYQIWEIPIVVAALLISPIAGIAISLLNTSVLFVVFPGALPTGPAYNLAATLSMQLGIFIALSIGKKTFSKTDQTKNTLFNSKWISIATCMGILFRVVFMSIIIYFALPQRSPIGYGDFGFDQAATNLFIPPAALFNATLALYTIPIAFIIAQRVQKVLHLTLPQTVKSQN